ncbi:hypothetical protein K438DRAFT_1977484 [Mycena galopus ATCC 62051]|nr:hypothetical protein K438DRAFT_1977484 [Mycena galopus ATCC 62051]
MVGNFVTPSQAQRKIFTRILGNISSGNYKLGVNSTNFIVQNRLSTFSVSRIERMYVTMKSAAPAADSEKNKRKKMQGDTLFLVCVS